MITREERLLLAGDVIVAELKKIDMFPALVQLWEDMKSV